MTDKYSPRERVQMICAGEKPDRYAASFWRHFYHMEHHAEGTAEAMLAFQKRFAWDFMKINPRAEYHVEDWGLGLKWSHDEFTKHTKTNWPIRTADDLLKIKPLPPTAPTLAEHLKVVSMIRRQSDKELPVLMTVFTPLAVIGRMIEDNKGLAGFIREAPDKVHTCLRAVTDTFKTYAGELRNAGADGLFFATTHYATSDMLTWAEYQEFGVPYDLEVIRAAEDDAMNLFHICGSNNYLKELKDLNYPVMMYNWDDSDPTNVPLDKAYDLIPDKGLVGGVDRNGWLLKSTAEEVGYQIERLLAKHDSSRIIVGPGCSIPPEVPMENLHAIRERL
jgi:uroporphyrinogen decarboxylase